MMPTVIMLSRLSCAIVALLIVTLMVVTGVNQSYADQGAPSLEGLFEDLAEAQNPNVIKVIENQILDAWRETESDSIDLLMNRAIRALAERDFDTALLHFDDVIKLAPDYAEGWNRRATLFFVMGRYPESIRDIERTVDLEPRHFGAWSGLGQIFVELGNDQGALEAYRRALEANPHLEEAAKVVKRLTKEVEGRGI
jgi:tetratricopeptide (TPR) repeat protein